MLDTGTFPTPIDQHLSSTRYLASPLCIIPTTDPDLWGVFGAYGDRDSLGIMTTDEMVAFVRQHWLDTQQRNAAIAARERAPKVSTAELDDILGDLDF